MPAETLIFDDTYLRDPRRFHRDVHETGAVAPVRDPIRRPGSAGTAGTLTFRDWALSCAMRAVPPLWSPPSTVTRLPLDIA
jgi:hypothetical protein